MLIHQQLGLEYLLPLRRGQIAHSPPPLLLFREKCTHEAEKVYLVPLSTDILTDIIIRLYCRGSCIILENISGEGKPKICPRFVGGVRVPFQDKHL